MASGNWKMVDSPEMAALWAAQAPEAEVPRVYQDARGLTAIVGREPYSHDRTDPDLRWHISLRYGDPGLDGRIPTWGECVTAAHELRPGICFVIGIPPRSWWMNVHPHVLHLIETRDAPLIQSFRDNAMAAAPS